MLLRAILALSLGDASDDVTTPSAVSIPSVGGLVPIKPKTKKPYTPPQLLDEISSSLLMPPTRPPSLT